MRRLPVTAALLAALSLSLAACGSEEANGIDMRPGSECLSCHDGSGEAPRFAAAGTVVRAAGASGLTVSVTVGGSVQTTTTASSGNFAIRGSGTVTAATVNGTAMPGGNGITGRCNACHGGNVPVP